MRKAPTFENALEFAAELIRIPGLPGEEGAVAERLRGEMEDLGLEDVRVDEAGNVMCSVDGNDLVRASDGQVVLSLHGNRLEDADGDAVYSFAADHVYSGHVSDQTVSFTATDNLSKGTTARKLQIGTLMLGIDDCISGGRGDGSGHEHPDAP